MHLRDSFVIYKDQCHCKDLLARDANHITNNEPDCWSGNSLEAFNEKKMHRKKLDNIVKNLLYHKASNQEIHDEVSRMESIVELNNNNKNVIEFVTSNKENSNLQRDVLHSKGKESILGEWITTLEIAADESGHKVVRGQIDSIKDEAFLTDMDTNDRVSRPGDKDKEHTNWT